MRQTICLVRTLMVQAVLLPVRTPNALYGIFIPHFAALYSTSQHDIWNLLHSWFRQCIAVSPTIQYTTAGLNLPTAAIACGIALSSNQNPIPQAVEMACQYIEAGISRSFMLGHGNGPINHFHSLSLEPLPPSATSLRRSEYRGKNLDRTAS